MENIYSNYYTMIANVPTLPMTAAMSNYNPTLGLTAAGGMTTDSELKNKEESPPNPSAGGKWSLSFIPVNKTCFIGKIQLSILMIDVIVLFSF